MPRLPRFKKPVLPPLTVAIRERLVTLIEFGFTTLTGRPYPFTMSPRNRQFLRHLNEICERELIAPPDFVRHMLDLFGELLGKGLYPAGLSHQALLWKRFLPEIRQRIARQLAERHAMPEFDEKKARKNMANTWRMMRAQRTANKCGGGLYVEGFYDSETKGRQ